MTSKAIDKRSLWETDDSDEGSTEPTLESVLARIVETRQPRRGEPDQTKVPSGEGDPIYRETAKDEIAVSIRSLPRVVWETIRFISLKSSRDLTRKKSTAEGALIHCGLNVLERIVKDNPWTEEEWLEAYESGDVDTLRKYIDQRFEIENLGQGINQTKKVYFLNNNDQARAMQVATVCGLSLSQVVTICMVAGISKSVLLLPKMYVQVAQKEIASLEKWIMSKQGNSSKKQGQR